MPQHESWRLTLRALEIDTLLSSVTPLSRISARTYLAEVFDLVAPVLLFASLITFAATGLAGCRIAA